MSRKQFIAKKGDFMGVRSDEVLLNGEGSPQSCGTWQDLKKQMDHIKYEESRCVSALEVHPTAGTWARLATVTLALIVCFNKGRSVVQQMRLSDYSRKSPGLPVVKGAAQEVMSVEVALSKNIQLAHVVVMGKDLRWVPILLTPLIERAVDLLVGFHHLVDPDHNSPYVFAKPFTQNATLRYSETICDLALESGASIPDLLKAMNLRSSFGARVQIYALSRNEVFSVFKFMGCDISKSTFDRTDVSESTFDRTVSLFLHIMEEKTNATK